MVTHISSTELHYRPIHIPREFYIRFGSFYFSVVTLSYDYFQRDTDVAQCAGFLQNCPHASNMTTN